MPETLVGAETEGGDGHATDDVELAAMAQTVPVDFGEAAVSEIFVEFILFL